jgi:hypothetical protein
MSGKWFFCQLHTWGEKWGRGAILQKPYALVNVMEEFSNKMGNSFTETSFFTFLQQSIEVRANKTKMNNGSSLFTAFEIDASVLEYFRDL